MPWGSAPKCSENTTLSDFHYTYCSDFTTLPGYPGLSLPLKNPSRLGNFVFSFLSQHFGIFLAGISSSNGGARTKYVIKVLLGYGFVACLILFNCFLYTKIAESVTKTPPSLVIDDFEDKDYKKDPEWWNFDKVELQIIKHGILSRKETSGDFPLGQYALFLQGKAEDWYVGGMGTYLAKEEQDLTIYATLEADVFGVGRESGRIKFELIDDDNGNWKVEYDEGWVPLSDDRFIYELPITWTGWKHVEIPFSHFKLDNPKRGNGVWDPIQEKGSGGLLQIQLIAIASSKEGRINFGIDNVSLRGKVEQ